MLEEQGSSGQDLVVVSNRGPVEHHLGPDGQIEIRRASGGLATALTALRQRRQFSWIASAVTAGDRYVAESCSNARRHDLTEHSSERALGAGAEDAREQDVELVAMPKDVFHTYYEVFSNRFLWFLQHSMWDLLQGGTDGLTIAKSWWEGYVPANRAFAQAVAARLRGHKKPAVMLQDYHLYLTPEFVRSEFPNVVLQHFIHIPWPAPAAWEALPAVLPRAILRGLLANDIIGFQTQASARNFLYSCESFLEDAAVDYHRRAVAFRGGVAHVRVYPISVDANALQETANSPIFKLHQERLRQICGKQTIVRVDRLDPSKNIAGGFHAFQKLLEDRPELQGKAKFLAFLVPSRTAVQEYRACYDEVMGVVQAINKRFGRDGFRPVEVFYENNCPQALAGMSLADVLLVNPRADGMNLVAKEGSIVSVRDSVLVLSRMAGAFEQLSEEALGIEPTDIDGTAKALADALAMSPEQRRERSLRLRASIKTADIFAWIKAQMNDIDEIIAQRTKDSIARSRPSFSHRRDGRALSIFEG